MIAARFASTRTYPISRASGMAIGYKPTIETYEKRPISEEISEATVDNGQILEDFFDYKVETEINIPETDEIIFLQNYLGEDGFGILFSAHYPNIEESLVVKLVPLKNKKEEKNFTNESCRKTDYSNYIVCLYDDFIYETKNGNRIGVLVMR